MHVDAILCNYAEVNNNLLYLVGGGIEIAAVQPGAPPPYLSSLALGIMITVPWDSTNKQHTLLVGVLDEDGQPVRVPVQGPEGGESPITVTTSFNVGRPPGLVAGDEQHISLAVHFGVLPFPRIGAYVFRVSIDGTEMRSLRYRIFAQPGAVAAGPATPGPLH